MRSHSQETTRHGDTRSRAVARWCARNGWPVHPLASGRKVPAANCEPCRQARHDPRECPCRAAGRWCHGFHAATTDLDLVDVWWGANPGLGVGVSCGPANLLVLDVDAHSVAVPHRDRLLPGIPIHDSVDLTGLASGFDTLALLAAYRGQPDPVDDTSTLRVRTPSGGMHIWYRTDPGDRYRSSTGSSPKTALAWQVDIRAHGGYIVAPTTRVPAGTYRPIGATRVPAPLPAWLADDLRRTGHTVTDHPSAPPPAPPPTHSNGGDTRDALRSLAPLLEKVAACAASPQGTGFSEKLNRAAYTAGGLVAAGRLTDARAHELLVTAADTARPQQQRRSASVIASALSAGARRPLHGERP
ncbi:bifunctional DNA primase/polymerase [Embleya sp. NBC_00896]|uniref:bifunctional DNA primase/polymerase n=1 Tax=Embleya sp. NBC_00896 TaxID=2975961 RepID=UPI002F9122A7|nr:bifunctional DNA primase/polymerase [Embleya sp. NBC_00896]